MSNDVYISGCHRLSLSNSVTFLCFMCTLWEGGIMTVWCYVMWPNIVTVDLVRVRAGDSIVDWYEGVSKSFWAGCLEWELQMVQLSATRCSCIAILWVSLVSLATITLCVTSQRVIPKVKCIFRYWLSPETFGYTLVCHVTTAILCLLQSSYKIKAAGLSHSPLPWLSTVKEKMILLSENYVVFV
jgi:hypothetical protein